MSTHNQPIPCHECAGTMTRDVRPRVLTCKGQTETVEMPGWYCGSCPESSHSGADMEVSDRAIRRFQTNAEKSRL